MNVSVNGNPIPYHMKIGDAGEAFFVFETEDDVPDDLITSPILQATTPTTDAAAVEAGAQASSKDERFAGDRGQQGDEQEHEEKLEEKRSEEQDRASKNEGVTEAVGEPEYLDLDGRSETERRHEEVVNQHITPKPSHHVPSFLKKSESRSTLNQSSYLDAPGAGDRPGDRTPEMVAQDQVVDDALRRAMKSKGRVPEVEYHHGMWLVCMWDSAYLTSLQTLRWTWKVTIAMGENVRTGPSTLRTLLTSSYLPLRWF